MSTNIEKMDAARSGTGTASAVEYATFPNAMPSSQETAPRLGRAYASGVAGQHEVYECMKSLGYQMGEAEAVRVWNAAGLTLKDRMPKDGHAYNLGFVRFFPALAGTFDSADAEFDPKRNRLYVAAAPSDEIRNVLLKGVPTRTGEMSANDARIHNVTCDENSVQLKNTIRSDAPFDILGSGITIGKGDESAELNLPEGGTVTVNLSTPEDDTGTAQRLIGRLTQPVADCEGATLSLFTHGFDKTAQLQKVISNNLTIIGSEAPTPTLTDVYSREDEPGTIMQDEAFQLIGTNLTLGESGKVEAQLADTEDPDHWYDLTGTASNLDAERIRLSDLAWETLGPDVQVSTDHSRVKFRVTIGGKSAEIVANAALA